MKTVFSALGASAFISFLFTLPFMLMEWVNRRQYAEDFPFMLFFVLWVNTFVFCLILLPILLGWWRGKKEPVDPPLGSEKTLLNNPMWAAVTGALLFALPFILAWLDSQGWINLDAFFNGPDPEKTYLPGQIFTLLAFSIPAGAGVITGGPIVRTLRSGGSLFAHPLNLVIVVLIVSIIGYGIASLLIDQWPCFIGVPVCD